MNDQAPTPNKRTSLIAVLKEAGKTVEQINAVLIEKKYEPLTAVDLSLLSLDAPKPAETAKPAEAVEPESAQQGPKTDITSPTGEPVSIAGVKLHPKFAQVVGEVDGSPVNLAQKVANDMMHNMADFCKAACGPEWSAAYWKIKYPNGDKSKATAETKLKAYTFVFETVLKLKMSVIV